MWFSLSINQRLHGTYRLSHASAVEIDEIDKLVHTCKVVYKLIEPITDANNTSFRDVVTKQRRVSVQRLVLILPVEEQ